jgi:hypothetical protein
MTAASEINHDHAWPELCSVLPKKQWEVKMARFAFGAPAEQKPTVLLWRLPKRPVAELPTVPQHENLKKPARKFGRRTTPPQG